MARNTLKTIEDLALGQNVEIVTRDLNDKKEWTHRGVVADVNRETEMVNVTDEDTGKPEWFIWGASDEETREWIELTDDSVPLTVDQEVAYLAISYQEKRDALISAFERKQRLALLEHQAELAKLQLSDYRKPAMELETKKTA